jgi:hypothetical protein
LLISLFEAGTIVGGVFAYGSIALAAARLVRRAVPIVFQPFAIALKLPVAVLVRSPSSQARARDSPDALVHVFQQRYAAALSGSARTMRLVRRADAARLDAASPTLL